jgi:DNA-binding IclR family transcriptional regulator
VNRLARDLDLVPSTCLHILRVLKDEGLVEFEPQTKRYSIGVGILPIARSAVEQNSFAKLIEPRLTDLSRKFGGTAIATQLVNDDHMIVVALSRAQQPFRLQVDLGSRFPALISATGRCHMAFNLGSLTATQLKQRFAQLKWNQPPSYRKWKQECDSVLTEGFAIDRGDYISGVTVVAVPVTNRSDRMTHSIVFIDISERIEATGIAVIVDSMKAARDEVADLLMGQADLVSA